MGAHTPVVALGIAAAIVCAANWASRWRGSRRLELFTKPTATVLIAALGVASAVDGREHAPTAVLAAGMVGFVCCLAGDIALLPAVDRFVVGLGSFLVGHLAFVVMFAVLGLDVWWLGVIALGGTAVVATVVGRPIVAGAVAKAPAYAMPVRAYLAVISVMAVVGWATGRPAAVLGSASFVASDSVLGWEQFVSERSWMPVVIMVSYHGALTGLALSLL